MLSVEGEIYVCTDIGIHLAIAVINQSLERLGLRVGDTVTVTCKAEAVQVY